MIQFFILMTGALAIWLIQSENVASRRHACFIGLVGQPFWLYESAMSAQWGMFLLSAFYTLSWIKGLKVHRPKGA